MLTPRELSDETGFSIGTLANWRSEGKGPRFCKVGQGTGSRVRYARNDVDAWLASIRTDR